MNYIFPKKILFETQIINKSLANFQFIKSKLNIFIPAISSALAGQTLI